MPRLTTLLALATLSASAALSAQTADPAGQPSYIQSTPAPIEHHYAPQGTVNPAQQGAVNQNQAPPPPARPVDTQATLAVGQTLATTVNFASAQPTPGVYVRAGQNSTLRAVAVDPAHTELRVEHGIVNISVHHPEHGAEILVDLPGGQTGLLKDGLYTFNAETDTIRVLKGEADAYPGSNLNAKPIKVKEDHAVTFSGANVRSTEFAPIQARADLVPYNGGHPDGAVAYRRGYSSYGYAPYGDGFYPGYYDPYFSYGWGYPGYGWGYPGYGPGFGLGFGYFGGYYGGGFRGGYGGGFRGRR